MALAWPAVLLSVAVAGDGGQAWRLQWQPFTLSRRHRGGAVRRDAGLLVQLQHPDGRWGTGELAPLPERRRTGADPQDGGHLEVLRQDLDRLDAAAGANRLAQWLQNTACRHPCSGFALGSALLLLEGHASPAPGPCPLAPWPPVALLPPGADAVASVDMLLEQGCRCFKWKMAAWPWAEERQWLAQLLRRLALVGGELRLDANGGISRRDLPAWLAAAADPHVAWLEQPLAADDPALDELLRCPSLPPGVRLALDESLPHLAAVEQQLRSPPLTQPLLVLKPAQLGDPRRLRELLQQWPGRCVISTSYEGEAGRAVVHQLARLAAAGGSPLPGLAAGCDLQPGAAGGVQGAGQGLMDHG